MRQNRIRVLIAKPGLDGHEMGGRLISRVLMDAGMEVIYTGPRQTAEMVVSASLQEDVDVIGMSFSTGAYDAHVPEVIKLLKEKGMEDVMVLVGGLIPDEDVDRLKKEGIKEIFGAGSDLNQLIELVSTAARK